MKVKDLSGKIHNLQLHNYIVPKNSTIAKSGPHLKCRELLKEIYPNDSILEEVHVPGEKLYLDFFLPLRHLVVEVHGQQHFEFTPFYHSTVGSFQKSKQRDKRKEDWCKLNNLILIVLNDNENEETWKTKLNQR